MSIQQQARALLSRHHHMIRNREQAMLLRTEAEVGLKADVTHYHSQIQGMTPHSFVQNYDRSTTAMS